MNYRMMHQNGDTLQFSVRRPKRIVELLRYYRSIGFVLALGACSATAPVTPAQIAASEKAVTIAEILALNYTRLPPCPTVKVCSDPVVKAKVKSYGQQAHDAAITLRTASTEGQPAALAALEVALAALTASIPVTN